MVLPFSGHVTLVQFLITHFELLCLAPIGSPSIFVCLIGRIGTMMFTSWLVFELNEMM